MQLSFFCSGKQKSEQAVLKKLVSKNKCSLMLFSQQEVADRQTKLQESALNELVATEQEYVSDLEMMEEVLFQLKSN
jgi:hypothetical protein